VVYAQPASLTMNNMKISPWAEFLALTAIALAIPSTLFSQMASSGAVVVNNLMPQPASLTVAPGRFLLTPQFSAGTTRFKSPRLDAAIHEAMRQLRQKTGLALAEQSASTGGGNRPTIAVQGAGEVIQSVDEDESYSLSVTTTGVRLEAATVVGAIRGLQTLVQLVQSSGSEYELPAVSIRDSPRFPWRGLMLDCGRHFEPVDVLKHTLDGMAAVKLNVFHWHLTEDQGFRIESKLFPKLTIMGSDGLFYTQQDVAEIVRYARARGIRVVPEVEMPGHSTAWLIPKNQRSPCLLRQFFSSGRQVHV
jgi:hexosaminidase